MPDLDAALAEGDTRPATIGCARKFNATAGLYEPRDVIERATGEAPSEGPLLDYLEAKFGAIYGV